MFVLIIGTRAEFIKTFPVLHALSKRKIPHCWIHTGQHNLNDLIKKFHVEYPRDVLTPPPKKSSVFMGNIGKSIFWSLKSINEIREKVNRLHDVKYVAYHGDTMSTLCAAVGTSRLLNPGKKYKNVHIEACLRSHSLFEPFPEEIFRIIVDNLSDILLSPIKKGKRDICIGNTIYDAAYYALKLSKISISGEYALASVHRHENIRSKNRMKKTISIIEESPYPVIFPLHDNTKKALMKQGLFQRLLNNPKVKVTRLYGYPEFIRILSHAKLVFTDGGSIQEECLEFRIPCVLLRYATERQDGLIKGQILLSKLDSNTVKKWMHNRKSHSYINPYGSRGASEKLIKVLYGF